MAPMVRRSGIIASLGLVLVLSGTAAAKLACEATVDRAEVVRGGHVVLTVTASGDFGRQPVITAPSIPGVTVTSGGTSQSFSFVNGRTESSFSVTYYLQVGRNDDFTIPSVLISGDTETCKTDPIAISVQAGGAQGSPPAPGMSPAQPLGGGTSGVPAAPRSSGPAAGRPGDDMFVTLTVDHDDVWVGEQVILSFRYFRRINPWDNPSYDPPSTEGCWRIDLPPERNYRQDVGGLTYQVTEIRYALFATQPGDLKIGSASLTFPTDPFARLFPGRRSAQNLRTAPLTIKVKELPLPRPADFSGLVARELSLTASVDRDTVPRGEPVAMDLNLTADAFLKSFGGLTVNPPAGVRLHDANEDLREDTTGPRYRATLKQEKVLVPTQEGTLKVPVVSVRYFDPRRGSYAVASTRPRDVVVTGSDLPVVGDEPSGFRRTEIERLSHDLAFIHTVTGRMGRPERPLLERGFWWAAVLLPVVLLALLRVILHRQAVARRDPASLRRRRALAVARKTLAAVRRQRDAAERLAGIAGAIGTYVADCTDRAPAGLTATDVRRLGEERGRSEASERLAEILILCDGARFGGAHVDDPAQLGHEAEVLLAQLDAAAAATTRSSRRVLARAVVPLLLVGVVVTGGRGEDLPPAAGTSPGVDPARLVAEGNRAYTDGDVQTARARYEEARAAGAEDPVLDYNLGNAYARQGHLGKAIVSYLRALRHDPRDRDVHTNLAWVRSHTRDLELGSGHLPPVIAQLDAGVHVLDLDEWALITLALVWLVTGLLALAWWRGYLGDGLRRLLLAGIAVLVLVVAITGLRWYGERVRDVAVVTADEVEVRSGPATTFPVVFRVHDGLTLVIRGEREGWARIGLGGDWVGWVPQANLEPVRQRGR